MALVLPRLTYLSFDSVTAGVGASQVLPYVRGLARRGVQVSLHTFEKVPPGEDLRLSLHNEGMTWVAHPFGAAGARGGLSRVLRGTLAVRGAALLHARSDLPAGCALLSRAQAWLWDMRGFWADERIELGALRAGSPEDRVMRTIERGAARSAGTIIALAASAIPVLVERHGPAVESKVRVIPTCVDLTRFTPDELPPPPVRLLMSGSLNNRYDVEAMVRFAKHVRSRLPTQLEVLCPDPSQWRALLVSEGALIGQASGAEMPARVVSAHAGLAIVKPSVVANKAMVPTKLAEFLACGRPVVVNSGLGDMDDLLARYDCGVSIDGVSDAALDDAATELERLLSDPSTPGRCRLLAEDHFSLDRAITSLTETYQAVLGHP
jgi:glycosyltransferase involved in cell wall biosynthesis